MIPQTGGMRRGLGAAVGIPGIVGTGVQVFEGIETARNRNGSAPHEAAPTGPARRRSDGLLFRRRAQPFVAQRPQLPGAGPSGSIRARQII